MDAKQRKLLWGALSVISTLHFEKTKYFVFSQNSLVRKIRGLGIFQITQKVWLWHCIDWIFHFLWPVCVQVIAIFSLSAMWPVSKKSPCSHFLKVVRLWGMRWVWRLRKPKGLWDRLVALHRLSCFSHDGMVVASCMPR